MLYRNYHSNHYQAAKYRVSEPSKDYEIGLVHQWLTIKPGTTLISSQNKSVIVVNNGIINKHEGPDILHAQLVVDGELKMGDVECHLEAADWYRHKHHINGNYNNVILHVVRNLDSNKRNPNIPTVKLASQYLPKKKCTLSLANKNENTVDTIINFGYARLQRKINNYSGVQTDSIELSKKLIRDSFSIIGAGGNKVQFNLLANNIDIAYLSRLDANTTEEYLQTKSLELKITWLRKGIRPVHQPQNRMRLAAELAKYFSSNQMSKSVEYKAVEQSILDQCPSLSGKGIKTEIFGNVIIPYLASRNLFHGNYKNYKNIVDIWSDLRLPIPYRKFQQKFAEMLPPKELKSFPILQGLIEIDANWCQNNLCLVCPLKDKYNDC